MRMSFALGGAIAAAAVLALVGARSSNSRAVTAEPAATAPAPELPDNALAGNAAALQGEVLETLPVAKYTYLRLATATGEVWAAVPSATVAPHSHVQIADATSMQDFTSTTLKRTFKVIYFGTLGSPSATPTGTAAGRMNAPELRAVADNEPLPPGHPDLGSAPNADSLPPGHPSPNEAAPFDAPSHPAQLAGTSAGNEAALPNPPAERAPGKNAYLVAELVATRATLTGRPVRVRGQVTKVTDVQDHAFFHIRDASLGPDGKPADIVVTSKARPTRGDIAIFEGVLRTDVDVGIGYKYPALLENATISSN
ncbi:MAG: hypothetical protein ABJB12_13115 [Pseudomonadota bacterium]